jgi:hypothetical protein
MVVQIKPIQELFWMTEYRLAKQVTMDTGAKIPLTHPLLDLRKEIHETIDNGLYSYGSNNLICLTSPQPNGTNMVQGKMVCSELLNAKYFQMRKTHPIQKNKTQSSIHKGESNENIKYYLVIY